MLWKNTQRTKMAMMIMQTEAAELEVYIEREKCIFHLHIL